MRPARQHTRIERGGGAADRLTWALVLLAIAGAASSAQPSRSRAREATVTITVQPNGRALVQGYYAFVGNPGAMSFEWLERPCASVGPVHLESQGAPVPYARIATPPWVRLHDTASVDPGRDSLGYRFRYEVTLRGRDVAIPVLLPKTVLGPRGRTSLATLWIELPLGDRVTLPRMTRAENGRWFTHMVALPSAVRVSRDAPNEPCQPVGGSSGRFVLIFWALVATLVLWVPLYLWWANRDQPA